MTGLDGATLALWRDVAVPLRDGTITRADIWRPVDDGPVPAVLMRTPYGKERGVPSAVLDPATAVAGGFAVIVQDVRGTGTSDGEFEPFVREADDGYDTIAWVADQPWCDGNVVMTGMSYVGIVQWLAASRQPPALVALTPTITTDSVAEGWSFRGGVLESGFLRTWVASSLAKPELRVLDDLDAVAEDGDAAALTAIAPWSAPWFSEPADSGYWAERSPAAVSRDLPALIIAGWYDCFLAGSLRSFADRQGPRDRLIIGPWGHEPTLTHLVGEQALGSSGFSDLLGLRERTLAFYRAALAGEDPPGPRVLAYLLGARRWLELESWPPPGARPVTLELSGSGSFRAGPEELPRAVGGRRLQGGVPGGGFGPRDQRAVAGSGYALQLDAVPAEALVATGRATAALTVAATGDEPRQWVGILCLEDADGKLMNIADGACIAPAGASEITLDLGDICIELPPGSRISLLVSGGLARRFPAPATAAEQRVDGASLTLTVT